MNRFENEAQREWVAEFVNRGHNIAQGFLAVEAARVSGLRSVLPGLARKSDLFSMRTQVEQFVKGRGSANYAVTSTFGSASAS